MFAICFIPQEVVKSTAIPIKRTSVTIPKVRAANGRFKHIKHRKKHVGISLWIFPWSWTEKLMNMDLLDWKLGKLQSSFDAEIKRFGQIFGCLHVLETHKYQQNQKMPWGTISKLAMEAFHFGFGARFGSLPETLKNMLRLGDEVTALGEYKGTIDLGAGITASIDIKAEGNWTEGSNWPNWPNSLCSVYQSPQKNMEFNWKRDIPMIFWAEFMGKVGSLRPLAIRWVSGRWSKKEAMGMAKPRPQSASVLPSSMPCWNLLPSGKLT